MQSDYARQYEDLWRRHWWWRARERFVAAHLRRLLPKMPAENRHILDIGCGNGLFFDTLRRYGSVQGIEPDASLVTDGPHRASIAVRLFDASFAPERPVDLVLMLDVLEHIEDAAAALRHVHTILAPGGTLLLTVPALMLLWSRHDVANRHYRRYTRSSLRAALATAGFAVESVRYFFGWTIAPMLLRRALSPESSQQAATETYHVTIPPAPVNAAMYAASRLEQLGSFNGRLGLPLGSSLMALAHRP